MTPEAGRRAPFELLAFTAAPVAGALVVIELDEVRRTMAEKITAARKQATERAEAADQRVVEAEARAQAAEQVLFLG